MGLSASTEGVGGKRTCRRALPALSSGIMCRIQRAWLLRSGRPSKGSEEQIYPDRSALSHALRNRYRFGIERG